MTSKLMNKNKNSPKWYLFLYNNNRKNKDRFKKLPSASTSREELNELISGHIQKRIEIDASEAELLERSLLRLPGRNISLHISLQILAKKKTIINRFLHEKFKTFMQIKELQRWKCPCHWKITMVIWMGNCRRNPRWFGEKDEKRQLGYSEKGRAKVYVGIYMWIFG